MSCLRWISARFGFVTKKKSARCSKTFVQRGSIGIVLFSSLIGAVRAIRAGLEVDVLNVGHIPEGPGKKAIHPAIHVGPAEKENFRQLRHLGVEISIQARPDDTPMSLSEFISMDSSMSLPVVTATTDLSITSDLGHIEAELEVVNEKGLHLRAAHILAQLAGGLEAEIQIGSNGQMVNAKSLLGLTTLGAARGTVLKVVVDGPKAPEALEALRNLFASGFHEGVAGNGS